MIYILVLIGLILIYIGLKFDKRSNNEEVFKNFIPGNADIDKIKEQEETIKYLSARMDDIESALLMLNEKIYEIKNLYQNTGLQENISAVENISEDIIGASVPENSVENNVKNNVEDSVKKADNRSNINEIIYELYDSGSSIEEIASKLRIGKGEVSLRLGLRK